MLGSVATFWELEGSQVSSHNASNCFYTSLQTQRHHFLDISAESPDDLARWKKGRTGYLLKERSTPGRPLVGVTSTYGYQMLGIARLHYERGYFIMRLPDTPWWRQRSCEARLLLLNHLSADQRGAYLETEKGVGLIDGISQEMTFSHL